jgi:endonuclease/exonuclease/phosphatase family metal-dependent hydrolase
LLEVVFETEGERWSLFVVHLKSKWTERADDPQAGRKRAGEATAARNRILERHDPAAGALYVVAGDFNDTRDTAPLRRFLQRGSVPIATILPAADSRGHAWTHHWARQDLYSRVDFLLPSPAMAERAEAGRGHVYDGPGYSEASDHRIVWADFRLGVSGGTTGAGGKGLVELLRMVGPEKSDARAEGP